MFNKFDSYIETKDTLGALEILNSSRNCDRFKTAYRHNYIADFYYTLDSIELSKQEMINAVQKGFLLAFETNKSFWETFREIKRKYGSEFTFELIEVQENKLNLLSPSQKVLRAKLLNIEERDQRLRTNPEYKLARNYDFLYKLDSIRVDDEYIHKEKLNLAKEFREKDSLILVEFINISDSLGYVPNPGDLMFNDIVTLMCHSSHILFDVDELFNNSCVNGSISPKYYAWWKGYYEEYFGDGKTFSYYYTHSEEMIQEANLTELQKQEINFRRKQIGLPKLPFSLWSRAGIW